MRYFVQALVVVLGFVVVLVHAPKTLESAVSSPAQKCTAVKFDTVARGVVAHVSCQARAVEKGGAVRARCHENADRRLGDAIARIERRGGCPTVNDAAVLDEAIDGLVDALVAGATTGRCGATKLRVAAQRAAGELACGRAAARKGVFPAAACLEKVETRFFTAFERAEKRLTCGTTGDATAVQGIVDAFLGTTVTHLTGATPTPSPTVTPGPAPLNLTSVIDGADVDLTWTAPSAASSNTHVRVLRRLDTAPTDAADPLAAIVFFGTVSAATDPVTALLPSTATTARTYHYAAFGCTSGGTCETIGSRTTLAPSLVEVLRAGGYVLHWRHAAADVCVDKTALGPAATTISPDWWRSCDANCTTATARQMNATGVMQATTIGQQLDRLAIPIGRVASSEYCRNFRTAELMDFGPTIELRQDITLFVYNEAGRCDASYTLIDEVPAVGTNTALIGHAGFSPTCPILGDLAWGEAAIFKPDGSGGETLVARVFAESWAGF